MQEHNRYFWEGRADRAQKAEAHFREMARKHAAETAASIKKTQIYDGCVLCVGRSQNVTISMEETDSVSSILKHKEDGKVAVLNFASFKNPGGGFLNGSRAQEEGLCHESNLYNILLNFDSTFYSYNRRFINRGLYLHRALYSPNVIFERGSETAKCDVITCAAPNYSVAKEHVSRQENNNALRERARMVLNIAKKNKVNTLILGAWGCGVFRQDPEEVAKIFYEEIHAVLGDTNMHVIFAVIPPLPGQTDNMTPFQRIVQKRERRKSI